MALKSWLESANDPGSDFPIQNLPYGVFSSSGGNRIGVAIGDQILDLYLCATNGLLDGVPDAVVSACSADVLNPLMALGPAAWSALRRRLTALLDANQANHETQDRVSSHFIQLRDAAMQLPASIGDYTDFYSSIDHAT